MKKKTIDPQEHYAKLKEIDAKIRIVINELVNQYNVEIDSHKNEIINVTTVNVYLDRLEENYDEAETYFSRNILQEHSIWGYLAEHHLGSNRVNHEYRREYVLAFEDEIVSYNFYFKESD